MTGWIIGATVRHTGKLVEKTAQRQDQQGLRKKYPDSGYTLKTDNKYFVWKITRSLMTTPLEALDADVERLEPYTHSPLQAKTSKKAQPKLEKEIGTLFEIIKQEAL